MSISAIINNLLKDPMKLHTTSGLLVEQVMIMQMQQAAAQLKMCIESQMKHGSTKGCVGGGGAVKVFGLHLEVDVPIAPAFSPSFVPNYSGADLMWLLNYGYQVKKNVWFKNIPRVGSKSAEHYVEKGVAMFKGMNPECTVSVNSPGKYWW